MQKKMIFLLASCVYALVFVQIIQAKVPCVGAMMLLLGNRDCQLAADVYTGDNMVMGIEDMGGYYYRLYLNFVDMPGERYFQGESAPNASWETRAVTTTKEGCNYVELVWPYPGEKVHFTWLSEESNSKKHYAEAEKSGSSFTSCVDSDGNKQFCALLAKETCILPTGVSTGDHMITGVEDRGGDIYRLYLNFAGMPGKGRYFLGEDTPGVYWKTRVVTTTKESCNYVDVEWSYPGEKMYFTWYSYDGKNSFFSDAENGGSKFATCIDGDGNKQFCLNPAEVVSNN